METCKVSPKRNNMSPTLCHQPFPATPQLRLHASAISRRTSSTRLFRPLCLLSIWTLCLLGLWAQYHPTRRPRTHFHSNNTTTLRPWTSPTHRRQNLRLCNRTPTNTALARCHLWRPSRAVRPAALRLTTLPRADSVRRPLGRDTTPTRRHCRRISRVGRRGIRTLPTTAAGMDTQPTRLREWTRIA